MAFANDTMTGASGTLITSHTSDSGHSWAASTGSGNTARLSNANRARADSGVDHLAYISATSTDADYDVEGDVVTKSATGLTGVTGRDRGPEAINARYVFGHDADAATDRWFIGKWVAGVFTALGTSASATLTIDQAYAVKLEMRGTTIKGYADAVEKYSVVDSGVTVAGRAGFLVKRGSDATGIHLDNWSASNPAAGGASIVPLVMAYTRRRIAA